MTLSATISSIHALQKKTPVISVQNIFSVVRRTAGLSDQVRIRLDSVDRVAQCNAAASASRTERDKCRTRSHCQPRNSVHCRLTIRQTFTACVNTTSHCSLYHAKQTSSERQQSQQIKNKTTQILIRQVLDQRR